MAVEVSVDLVDLVVIVAVPVEEDWEVMAVVRAVVWAVVEALAQDLALALVWEVVPLVTAAFLAAAPASADLDLVVQAVTV